MEGEGGRGTGSEGISDSNRIVLIKHDMVNIELPTPPPWFSRSHTRMSESHTSPDCSSHGVREPPSVQGTLKPGVKGVGINRGRNAWMKGEGNDVCLQCTRIRCSQILKHAPQICVPR